jgi:hypothetical protein
MTQPESSYMAREMERIALGGVLPVEGSAHVGGL